MEGWKQLGSLSDKAVPETIKQNAQAFFQTLPKIEQNPWIDDPEFAARYWEDGTGQHAAVLQCPHDGENWYYALIYNRNNRRIKVLKYSTGSYGITNTSKYENARLAYL